MTKDNSTKRNQSPAQPVGKVSLPSKTEVDKALRTLGGALLKQPWRDMWSSERPSTGYCYLVSESIYHFASIRTFPYFINLGKHGTHWFLHSKETGIVDMTGDQFDFTVPYGQARRGNFYKGKIQTPRGFISQRGFQVARCLKLI